MRSIKRILTNIALGAFLTSVSTISAAKCPTDLRGEWQGYLLNPSGTQYSSCTFSTDRAGILEPGSTCQLFNAVLGDPGADPLPATGQYVVNGDSCEVTGVLEISGGFVTIQILKASISNDGGLISGIQTDDFTNSVREFLMFRIN